MTGYNFFKKITNLFSRNISNQILLKNIFYLFFFYKFTYKKEYSNFILFYKGINFDHFY